MSQVKFLRGQSSNIKNINPDNDAFYLTTDNQQLLVAKDSKLVPVNADIIRGEGTNSIVANDLSTNTAISENVCSFGTNNKGGLKGYYWSAINIENKTITLATAHTGGTAVTCGYAVGDVISIVNDAKYDKCSKITAINGSVITVDSLPFTSVVDVGTSMSFDDYSIYCPAKPNIGAANLGKAAFATGDGCVAGNYATFAAGRNNDVYGQYGAAVGRQNEVGYGGFSYGRDNTNDGLYNIVGGVSNKTSNTNSVAVFGGTNTLHHSNASFVAGSAHGVDSSYNSMISGYHNGAYYAMNATITGGENYISNSSYSAVIGNHKNSINGGAENTIVGSRQSHISNSANSLVIGGYDDYINTTSSGSESAIISSRKSTITNSWNSVIIGGENNRIYGKSANYIFGGNNNKIDGAAYSSRIIGSKNSCSAADCTLIGFALKNTTTQNQIILGKFNETSDKLFVIGNGTSDTNRKNALEIDANSNVKLAGNITLGNNGTISGISSSNGSSSTIAMSQQGVTQAIKNLQIEPVAIAYSLKNCSRVTIQPILLTGGIVTRIEFVSDKGCAFNTPDITGAQFNWETRGTVSLSTGHVGILQVYSPTMPEVIIAVTAAAIM